MQWYIMWYRREDFLLNTWEKSIWTWSSDVVFKVFRRKISTKSYFIFEVKCFFSSFYLEQNFRENDSTWHESKIWCLGRNHESKIALWTQTYFWQKFKRTCLKNKLDRWDKEIKRSFLYINLYRHGLYLYFYFK